METPSADRRAAVWIKLARAMCYVDRESLPVEERASIGYAGGVLQLSDEELNAGREYAATLTVTDAVDEVAQEPDGYRDRIFTGMLIVAWADGRVRDEERELLAALATRWGLDERRLETECIAARHLARGILEDPDDAD